MPVGDEATNYDSRLHLCLSVYTDICTRCLHCVGNMIIYNSGLSNCDWIQPMKRINQYTRISYSTTHNKPREREREKKLALFRYHATKYSSVINQQEGYLYYASTQPTVSSIKCSSLATSAVRTPPPPSPIPVSIHPSFFPLHLRTHLRPLHTPRDPTPLILLPVSRIAHIDRHQDANNDDIAYNIHTFHISPFPTPRKDLYHHRLPSTNPTSPLIRSKILVTKPATMSKILVITSRARPKTDWRAETTPLTMPLRISKREEKRLEMPDAREGMVALTSGCLWIRACLEKGEVWVNKRGRGLFLCLHTRDEPRILDFEKLGGGDAG